MQSIPSTEQKRLTLNLQAAERALQQRSEYEVQETSVPGQVLVVRNGASYRVDVVAETCTCEHFSRRCAEAGAFCKHLARAKAHVGAKAEQLAIERAAMAKRDRELIW